jgi:hypothetical protein
MQLNIEIVFVFYLISFGMLGCASSPKEANLRSELPGQRVFSNTYDEVWRATAIAMSRYPLSTNNMNIGSIETEEIKGSEIWRPPYLERPLSNGLRYKLFAKVTKGRQTKKKHLVRVTILKDTKLYRDFFSEPEAKTSDGVEEMVILYRIQRELEIDELKKNSAPTSPEQENES